MKRRLLVSSILCLSLACTACALIPRRAAEIKWPEKIEYMRAMCELDMAWKDMNYSGSMALKLDYPDMFQIEVYGAFGETIVFIKKSTGKFLLTAENETYTDETSFEEKFDIKLSDFIDDLASRGAGRNMLQESTVSRNGYKVSYNPDGKANTICWARRDGRICITFLEARFDEE